MEEVWKDIEGYEGLYQVSNLGRVKNIRTGRLLKPYIDKGGYCRVHLCIRNKPRHIFVHRLVAEAFIANPNNMPEVNHKSEVKTENTVDNLEWVSHKANINYGSRTDRTSTPVLQFSMNYVLINKYSSLHKASRETNVDDGHISQCCQGKRKTCRNFIWRYKENKIEPI